MDRIQAYYIDVKSIINNIFNDDMTFSKNPQDPRLHNSKNDLGKKIAMIVDAFERSLE